MGIISVKLVRGLIVIMFIVVAVAIFIAKSYYSGINRFVDPRIIHARELYVRYDEYAQKGDFYRVFSLLDSIEAEYQAIKHYSHSFERGVIYNNRAAALLTISLYKDSIPEEYNPFLEISTDSLILLAEESALNAIDIYEKWSEEYSGKSAGQISEILKPGFLKGLENFDPDLKNGYLETRAKDLEKALLENDRRLSVCYTNLGVIYRMKGQYEDAVKQYEYALTLWDRNLEAENNLNRLLNRPLNKRNIIQKIFPPDREQ